MNGGEFKQWEGQMGPGSTQRRSDVLGSGGWCDIKTRKRLEKLCFSLLLMFQSAIRV